MSTSDTGITLREYVDVRMEANERAVAAALAAADRAVSKAEVASERRFESVNEFRQALTDQTRSFIGRIECEVLLQRLNEKIDSVQKIVWIALGIAIAFQVALGIVLALYPR